MNHTTPDFFVKKIPLLKPERELKPTEIELADLASLLGISNTATSKEVIMQLKKLKADKEESEAKLREVLKLQDAEKIATLVNGAKDSRKITAAQVEHFTTLAALDYETTKATLDSMISGDEAEAAELIKLSGKELWMQGKLELLKSKSLEHFKLKYKEFYNKEYAG